MSAYFKPNCLIFPCAIIEARCRCGQADALKILETRFADMWARQQSEREEEEAQAAE